MIENRREIFTGSISYMPLTLSTQRLLNVSGQIVTNKGFKFKKKKKRLQPFTNNIKSTHFFWSAYDCFLFHFHHMKQMKFYVIYTQIKVYSCNRHCSNSCDSWTTNKSMKWITQLLFRSAVGNEKHRDKLMWQQCMRKVLDFITFICWAANYSSVSVKS